MSVVLIKVFKLFSKFSNVGMQLIEHYDIRIFLYKIVRQIKFLQPMVITLEGGWIGWWSLFSNQTMWMQETIICKYIIKQYKSNCI